MGSSDRQRASSGALPRVPHSLRGLAPLRAQRSLRPTPRAGFFWGIVDYVAFVATVLLRFVFWFFLGAFDPRAAVGPGKPQRGRLLAAPILRVTIVILVTIVWRWRLANPTMAAVLYGGLFVLTGSTFVLRSLARAKLLDAATIDLGSRPPLGDSFIRTPRLLVGHTLEGLAVAVDRARRHDPSATRLLATLDTDRLEHDETRLANAARALVARDTGDHATAQLEALVAFPTGALPIDAELSDYLIERTLHDGVRLTTILERWYLAGFDPGDTTPVGAAFRLGLVKLCKLDPAQLAEPERQEFLIRARQLRDRELEQRLLAARPVSGSYR